MATSKRRLQEQIDIFSCTFRLKTDRLYIGDPRCSEDAYIVDAENGVWSVSLEPNNASEADEYPYLFSLKETHFHLMRPNAPLKTSSLSIAVETGAILICEEGMYSDCGEKSHWHEFFNEKLETPLLMPVYDRHGAILQTLADGEHEAKVWKTSEGKLVALTIPVGIGSGTIEYLKQAASGKKKSKPEEH